MLMQACEFEASNKFVSYNIENYHNILSEGF